MDHFWLQPQPRKVWPNQHAMKGWKKKHNHKFNHKLFCKFRFEHVVPKHWGMLARRWDHSLQQLLGTPGNRTAQLGLACLVFWRIWEVKPSWMASSTSLCTRVRRHCKVLYICWFAAFHQTLELIWENFLMGRVYMNCIPKRMATCICSLKIWNRTWINRELVITYIVWNKLLSPAFPTPKPSLFSWAALSQSSIPFILSPLFSLALVTLEDQN